LVSPEINVAPIGEKNSTLWIRTRGEEEYKFTLDLAG
jgi:hypothetical protein